MTTARIKIATADKEASRPLLAPEEAKQTLLDNQSKLKRINQKVTQLEEDSKLQEIENAEIQFVNNHKWETLHHLTSMSEKFLLSNLEQKTLDTFATDLTQLHRYHVLKKKHNKKYESENKCKKRDAEITRLNAVLETKKTELLNLHTQPAPQIPKPVTTKAQFINLDPEELPDHEASYNLAVQTSQDTKRAMAGQRAAQQHMTNQLLKVDTKLSKAQQKVQEVSEFFESKIELSMQNIPDIDEVEARAALLEKQLDKYNKKFKPTSQAVSTSQSINSQPIKEKDPTCCSCEWWGSLFGGTRKKPLISDADLAGPAYQALPQTPK